VAIVRWLADSLTTLFARVAEREYRQLCKTRPNLTDQEFYDAFYRVSEIPFDTCARVRRVLNTQLWMTNVRPDDNLAAIFDDLDLWDICFELGEEFGLQFPDDIVNSLDGTVDSLIRVTERLRTEERLP
jgi:acyl carrier protein